MGRLISRAMRAVLAIFRRNADECGRHHARTGSPVILSFYVNANFVTQLRHMLTRSCGDLLTYMRIAPTMHATTMRVWLCISQPATALVLQSALQSIPGIKFLDIAGH